MVLAPDASAKLDPELKAALSGRAGNEDFAALITLDHAPVPAPEALDGATRRRWARERETEFGRETEDLVRELEALGASGLRRHWIGRSLTGRMPRRAIETAAERPEVSRIELVRPRTAIV